MMSEEKENWVPVTDWKSYTTPAHDVPDGCRFEVLRADGSFDILTGPSITVEGDCHRILMYRILENRSGWVIPTLDAQVAESCEPYYPVRLICFDGDLACYQTRTGHRWWVDAKTGHPCSNRGTKETFTGRNLIPYIKPKEKQTLWVNLYTNGGVTFHKSETDADFLTCDRIACKKIIIEEGEWDA